MLWGLPVSMMLLFYVEITQKCAHLSFCTFINEDVLHFSLKDVRIFYREANPPSKPKFPILLLHGMAFTSATWVDMVKSKADSSVNTISFLAAAGYKVIAVDLPGIYDVQLQ